MTLNAKMTKLLGEGSDSETDENNIIDDIKKSIADIEELLGYEEEGSDRSITDTIMGISDRLDINEEKLNQLSLTTNNLNDVTSGINTKLENEIKARELGESLLSSPSTAYVRSNNSSSSLKSFSDLSSLTDSQTYRVNEDTYSTLDIQGEFNNTVFPANKYDIFVGPLKYTQDETTVASFPVSSHKLVMHTASISIKTILTEPFISVINQSKLNITEASFFSEEDLYHEASLISITNGTADLNDLTISEYHTSEGVNGSALYVKLPVKSHISFDILHFTKVSSKL